jgi:hypothetical protein
MSLFLAHIVAFPSLVDQTEHILNQLALPRGATACGVTLVLNRMCPRAFFNTPTEHATRVSHRNAHRSRLADQERHRMPSNDPRAAICPVDRQSTDSARLAHSPVFDPLNTSMTTRLTTVIKNATSATKKMLPRLAGNLPLTM